MQSTFIARIAQERRVFSPCALADHHHRCQWIRRTATAQEQQCGRSGFDRRQQAEMGFAGHIIRRPRGYIQEQDHLGNIKSLRGLSALLVQLSCRE